MEPKQTMSLTYHKARTIVANSTSEQERRLRDFVWGEGRCPEIWDTGFITPNQVTSYYCKKCNKTYEDAPNVGVSVSKLGSGEVDTSAAYHCSHCDNLIYYGLLDSPEGIPEEFIRSDETGDYKRPTIDSVNSLLCRIKSQASEGHGSSIKNPDYGYDLEIAKRWAEKIGYDIRPQVESLTELFKSGYIARLGRELPKLVAEIKDKAYGFSLAGFESDGVSHYEGEGLAERMDQLFQTIELTNPQNLEVNKDIFGIFELYWEMHHVEKERLQKEKTDLEERIVHEEEFLAKARRMQGEFVQKASMTNKQVEEARKSSLSTDVIPF